LQENIYKTTNSQRSLEITLERWLIIGHVLKGETSKRNDRNETAETIETTETKPPKRNDRNETAETKRPKILITGKMENIKI
jgi:hypothetical protein